MHLMIHIIIHVCPSTRVSPSRQPDPKRDLHTVDPQLCRPCRCYRGRCRRHRQLPSPPPRTGTGTYTGMVTCRHSHMQGVVSYSVKVAAKVAAIVAVKVAADAEEEEPRMPERKMPRKVPWGCEEAFAASSLSVLVTTIEQTPAQNQGRNSKM